MDSSDFFDFFSERPSLDLSILNDKQREAVMATEGPVLVLAGAGSGKTRVLTYRIAHLVADCGVHPYNVLALTFTNKSAREMRERTEALVGSDADRMWVTTFHSCCAKILRMDIDKIGYDKTFTVYDDAEKKVIISGVLTRLGIDDKNLNKNTVGAAISDAKNHSNNPLVLLRSDPYNGDKLATIYGAYEEAMRTANALDFDDLILITLRLFNECPDVLEKYRNKFKYVLVDEYQDTNLPQYELLRLLCEQHMNICVVGDDDQSIYGWRGADIRNILEFERDFPGAQVIRLEQNYRSTGTILKAANSVIKNNQGRKGKNLWTKSGDGDSIIHYIANNEHDEANYVCKEIAKAVRAGSSYKDHAILYRTNAQSRVLEATLLSFGMPYKVFGGFRFFERMEIKDIMSYLRLIINNDDDAAFRRVINTPQRGIGEASVFALSQIAADHNVSLFVAMNDPKLSAQLPTRTRSKFLPFAELMKKLIEISEETTASVTAKKVIELTGYLDYIATGTQAEYETRHENLQELIGSIVEMETASEQAAESDDDENDTKINPLAAFIESSALVSDIDAMDENDDVVSLMTVHSAKGLEFHTVYITGAEEDIFPSVRSIAEPDKLEEERRLFYVAITRARQKLYIINAYCRRLYNNTLSHKPSRFLEEIPDFLLTEKGNKNDFLAALVGTQTPSTSGYRPPTAKPEQQRAGIPTPKSPKTEAETESIRVGVRVRHETFGDGTVTAVSGSGKGKLITVSLDNGKEKRFAALYAPLTIIE